MPTRCVAVGCSNATPGTSLHTFPGNQVVRKLWMLATRRENLQPTRTSGHCSADFKNDHFVCDLQWLQSQQRAVFVRGSEAPTSRDCEQRSGRPAFDYAYWHCN